MQFWNYSRKLKLKSKRVQTSPNVSSCKILLSKSQCKHTIGNRTVLCILYCSMYTVLLYVYCTALCILYCMSTIIYNYGFYSLQLQQTGKSIVSFLGYSMASLQLPFFNWWYFLEQSGMTLSEYHTNNNIIIIIQIKSYQEYISRA